MKGDFQRILRRRQVSLQHQILGYGSDCPDGNIHISGVRRCPAVTCLAVVQV